MSTETTANLRLAGLTAPQARELRAIARNGSGTGVVGSLAVVRRLRAAKLVEWTGDALGDMTPTEAGAEALRVLDGGEAYVDERNRRQLAAAVARRHADGTTLRYMALHAGDAALRAELEANPRPATDEELRTFRALAADRAVAEGKERTHRATRRALAAWAEVDAIDTLLAERAAATAVELEQAADDELPGVVPGDRYYEAGAVHLARTTTAAACGTRLLGYVNTAAALTCAACAIANRRALEADVDARLEARRQAEAPAAPALPGIDAAVVEAELGAGLAEVLPAAEVLVVIPCGGTKLDHAAPAGELYRGSLHRSARLAADAIVERTPGARVVVLSALYGLLELDRVVEPYDVTVGDDDAIDVVGLALQIAATSARRVVALTPGRYTDLLARACRAAGGVHGPAVELIAPLAGARGVLDQRGRLRRIRVGELTLAA